MRVIDCECGSTIKAASDDALREQLREHIASDHPDDDTSDENMEALVSDRAYDADDA